MASTVDMVTTSPFFGEEMRGSLKSALKSCMHYCVPSDSFTSDTLMSPETRKHAALNQMATVYGFYIHK